MNRDFEMSWKKNFKTAEDAISAAVAEAAGQVIKNTVDRTPVGRPELWKSKGGGRYNPGELRRSWEASFGKGFKNISNGADYGGKVESNSDMKSYNVDYDIIIRNQLPYAQAVEYGWSRKQAPEGMLRISMLEFRSLFREALHNNKV